MLVIRVGVGRVRVVRVAGHDEVELLLKAVGRLLRRLDRRRVDVPVLVVAEARADAVAPVAGVVVPAEVGEQMEML